MSKFRCEKCGEFEKDPAERVFCPRCGRLAVEIRVAEAKTKTEVRTAEAAEATATAEESIILEVDIS